jgi:hypothetical protein
MIGGWIWKKRGSLRTGLRLKPYPYRYEALDEGTGRLVANGEARVEKDAVAALLRWGVDPQHINYGPPGGRRRNPAPRKRNPASAQAPQTIIHKDETYTYTGTNGNEGSAIDGKMHLLADGHKALVRKRGPLHGELFGTAKTYYLWDLYKGPRARAVKDDRAIYSGLRKAWLTDRVYPQKRTNPGPPFPADLEGMSAHALEDVARALEAALTPGQVAAARRAADRAAAKIGYPAAATYWKLLIRAMRHYAKRKLNPAYAESTLRKSAGRHRGRYADRSTWWVYTSTAKRSRTGYGPYATEAEAKAVKARLLTDHPDWSAVITRGSPLGW